MPSPVCVEFIPCCRCTDLRAPKQVAEPPIAATTARGVRNSCASAYLLSASAWASKALGQDMSPSLTAMCRCSAIEGHEKVMAQVASAIAASLQTTLMESEARLPCAS